MKRILSVLFWVLATAAICQPQSIQYFPQIAEGVQPGGIQWGMLIAITNPSTTFASGTLALMKDDGTPFPIRFGQGGGQSGFENPNQPSITFQLPPGQTTVFTSPGESGQSTTSLQTGFAMLFSNPVPLSATVIFSEFAPGGRIAQAGVLSATPSTRQEIIAVAPSPQSPMNLYPANTETSAIAVANPGADPANITYQLIDFNGQAAAPPVTRTLPAKNHAAFFVNQLFPGTTIGGTLRILSDVPIVATGLLFHNNGQFATFPVFPLP